MRPNGLEGESLAKLRSAVLRYYDCNHRRLSWRGTTDPYRILVSETMLQQTRTETVERYYEPWLARFPDLATLAAAEEEEVLKAWEGLGYYRRARHLHRAARVVVREAPGSVLPKGYRELKELPGIGEYTAGAIASIAFGERVPAVDGNVRRVVARIHDVAAPKPAWLRGVAARMVDPERPGDWNQALMDLGATVCAPRRPACDRCPAAPWCLARARETQEEVPAATSRAPVRRVTLALAILRNEDGRVLLERRPSEGLLGGMWAFPERELAESGEAEGEVLSIASTLDLQAVGSARCCESYPHRFSHLHATYEPCVLDVRGTPVSRGRPVSWIDPAGEIAVALPAAQRGIIDRLRARRAPTPSDPSFPIARDLRSGRSPDSPSRARALRAAPSRRPTTYD